MSACGETGIGRLAEASQIIDKTIEITRASKIDGPLKGKKVLVTSGPTIEPIDDIRFISNYSSGIQGNSIAEAFQKRVSKIYDLGVYSQYSLCVP